MISTNTCINDARTILKAASLLTLAAWAKRAVDRLSTTQWFDRTILHGKGPLAQTPTSSAPATAASTTHYGPGSLYMPGWGRLYYRNALTTQDGHTFYNHDSMLNAYHLGPCPLLHKDTECGDCVWHVDGGRSRSEPLCAALVRIAEMADDDALTLADIKRALEHSR